MFSTMITELLTMIPKLTAPMESRLADFPWRYSTDTENKSASGIISATMPAQVMSPRKTNRIRTTRPMPTTRLWTTLCVVTLTRSVRRLNGTIFMPVGRRLLSLMSLIFFSTASDVGSDFSYFRMSTMPSTTSFSPLRPTTPSRG